MTGIVKIKPGLRVLFAIAVIAAFVAIPAQAVAAQQGCADAGTDPTAAQYCQVAGVHTSDNDKPGTHAANESGAAPDAVSAAGTEVTPVTSQAVESSGGSLPFTGLDVGILAAVAAGLVGTGLVLRRLTASGVPRS